MAENTTVIDLLQVGGGFTAEQADALRRCFEVYEDRVAAAESSVTTLEVLAASFGDLSAADANDTLVADAAGVFQVNAVV